MKKLFIGLFIHISICSLNALHADDANLKLWYNSPADATVADNPNGKTMQNGLRPCLSETALSEL